MKDYHINIFYSDEDEGYVADIPDLSGCSAFGESPEAALAAVSVAKKAYLEAYEAKHHSMPNATYRPAIYQLANFEVRP